MRLTGLHLLGFKSFADKIELRFGPGVTAVVGPNGSGKSNIVDAVRWLLGEQNSRALRSARVTNLIFAGTEQRKPLGMAQATLVLDNSSQTLPLEYSEVSIVRRVYRSGESQFFINGAPCRLRDIQQLLLGTGLGRGGMAVVGQGEVDAILSAQPGDRRLLLEETAGTSRYRAQQRMAEQRLERARQDLARVTDLSYELTERVGTLTAQAAAAARYKEVTAALQRFRAARAARDWTAALQRKQRAEQQLAEQKQRLEQSERVAAQARASEESGRSAVEESVAELEAARERLRAGERTLAEASHRVELLQLQKRSATDKIERGEEERQRANERHGRLQAACEELRSQIAAGEAELNRLQKELSGAVGGLSDFDEWHERETSRLEKTRTDVFDVLQALSAQRSELEQLEDRAVRLAQQQEQVGRATRQLENQLVDVRKQLQIAKVEADAKDAQIADGRDEEQQLAAALQQAGEKLAAKRAKVESVRTRLNETEANYRALQRLETSYAGYRPAVKAVLSARDALDGLLGTVAQLIDVPGDLDVPIQIALGAATQFVVMSDENSVLQAIEFLRRRQSGRATFLALDALRPRPWPRAAEGVLAADGVVGRAAELVKAESAIVPVVDYLLGRTVIVEQLPRAQQLARGLPPAVRLVTMQGDLLTPGGPVTGGSRSRSTGDGTLSRRRELRSLEQQIALLQTQLGEADDAAAVAAADVGRLEETISERRTSSTTDVIDAANLRQKVTRLEAERDRLETAIEQHRSDSVSLQEQLDTSGTRAEQLKEAISETEGREGSLQAELQRLTEELRQADEQRRKMADDVSGRRAALAGREEALAGLRRRLDEATEELNGLSLYMKTLAEARTAAGEELAKLEEELANVQREIPVLTTAVDELKAAETEAGRAVHRRREQLNEIQAKVREAAAAVASLKEDVWTTQTALARHESALEGHEQRLRELSIEPKDAPGIAEEGEGTRREIRELEDELEAIGPVHLGAQAELEEAEERVRFLDEQKTDLEEAIQSLLHVIERLDKLSEERFAETLAKVAEQFEGIFRRLFEGGRARLQLSEEDDGVDVHVQMPGKREQNLLALSGGERALTAIALLFAILRVQPSPFYLLDEIDSALDEANLGRFQQLLREASEESQFIVITHRATTMEVADTIYGVTAAEPGVSTLISLDLQSAVATIA